MTASAVRNRHTVTAHAIRWGCLALLGAACLTGAAAQIPAAAHAKPSVTVPRYDVSAVRPNKSGSGDMNSWTHDAAYLAENVTLKRVMAQAFSIRPGLIFDLPPWAGDAHFDINAKASDLDKATVDALTGEQRHHMLRALLEDRFALKWHYETRILPAYDLVIGKNGPRLKPAPSTEHSGTWTNNTDLKATGVSVASLAMILSDELHRPVVDKTGLTGTYDYSLKWSREAEPDTEDTGKDTDPAPALFTAIQEQLGLKLQSAKDPVQVLVVDRVREPTEN